MNIDMTLNALSTIAAPSEAERDASSMTGREIEQAILDISGALRAFDTLLEILEHVTFDCDADKRKAETVACMVVQRMEWGLQVLMCLKPAN